MDLFLQQVAYGLVIGSAYAVVALGFALAFSVLRVIHFAHPDIFMIGMFGGLVAANAVPGGGLVVALIGGGAGAAVMGYAVERTVISPLRGRDVLTTLIGTLGVSIVLQNGMAAIVGVDPVAYPSLLPRRFVDIGPVVLILRQIANLGFPCCCWSWSASMRARPRRGGQHAPSRNGRTLRQHSGSTSQGSASSRSCWPRPWRASLPYRSARCMGRPRPSSGCCTG